MAGERDTRGLERARVDAGGLDAFQPVVAKGQLQAARLGAAHPALLDFAIFNFLGLKHYAIPLARILSSLLLMSSAKPGAPDVFFFAGQNLAAEDPHFHADLAVGGARLGE